MGDEYIRPLQTKLIVYDILGHEVQTLLNEIKAPGMYEVEFNAKILQVEFIFINYGAVII